MKILYVHGFNSSGSSSKVDQLKEAFPNYKIAAPTLSADPSEAYGQLVSELIEDYEDTIIVGTSLGGFYSLLISNRFDIPCFLINPSLEPHKTLVKKVGKHVRFGTDNEVYDFKQEYLEKLKNASADTLPSNQDYKLINVYLSKDDEQLDFSNIRKFIPKANIYKEFDNSGHRFSKFSEVIPDIRAYALEMEGKQSEDDLLF